jgi:ribonuclease BN (tRNA processing enzyme)
MTRKEFYTIEESDTIFNINSKGWYLKGWSRAGLKTGFLFYPFKILFDCGIYTSQKPDLIFLTHQHTDHTQAIAHICSRHKNNKSLIYLPDGKSILNCTSLIYFSIRPKTLVYI